MKTSVILSTTNPHLVREIRNDLPVGMEMRPGTNIKTGSIYDKVTLDIVFNIDIADNILDSAITYLLFKCSGANGKHYLNINGRMFPIKERDAIELETKKINKKNKQ